MEPRPGETVLFAGHPSWRSMLGFYVGGVTAALVAGVLVTVLVSAIGVLIGLVILAVVLGAGLAQRAATHYTITDERLYIRRGILSRSEQQTRITRVQNVNTRQSLFERLLRIGTVDFDTAADDDGDFSFVGVGSPREVVRAVDDAQARADGGGSRTSTPAG